MNLVLDIGNTSTKAALYNQSLLVSKKRFNVPDREGIIAFAGQQPIDGVIVSTVNKDTSDLIASLRVKYARVVSLSWEMHYPFKIEYDTPDTLGVDRLAAAAGAYVHYPHYDMLIIDAGSALTIDQVTRGAYHGGSISPGLSMRFRALNEFTGRLPLVSPAKTFSFPGRTTYDAIAGGVLMGMVFEINEYIRTFKEKYKKSVALLTGGDSEFISSFTGKNLLVYPDLVTDGLNYLLDTNA